MAITAKQKLVIETIVKRATKEPQFRKKLQKDLAGVLTEYKLTLEVQEASKLLPKDLFKPELSEDELKSIAGGFSLGGLVSGAWHDVEHAAGDVVSGVEDTVK